MGLGLDPAAYLLFVGSAIVLLVTPGPAVLFLVSQSLSRGVRAGVASACGLFAGGVVHMLAAILGVSALLATSATAFAVVKYLGAAYLIYLGVREFTGKPNARATQPGSGDLKGIVARAAWVNILNPKAALFFVAFLPQFVRPGAGNATAQLAVLGATFLGLAIVTDLSYVFLSELVRNRLPGPVPGSEADRLSTRRSRFGRFATGSVYVGLGLAAALGGTSDSGT